MYASRKFYHGCQNSLILSSDVQLKCQDKPSVKWDEQKALPVMGPQCTKSLAKVPFECKMATIINAIWVSIAPLVRLKRVSYAESYPFLSFISLYFRACFVIPISLRIEMSG